MLYEVITPFLDQIHDRVLGVGHAPLLERQLTGVKLREFSLGDHIGLTHFSKNVLDPFFITEADLFGIGSVFARITSYNVCYTKLLRLTLLECAFIAGSVKRPNYYNPFLRKNRANAEERNNFV